MTDLSVDIPVDAELRLDGAALAGPNDLRMPLVSVIITAYNCERFVRKTLESVLAQSYSRFECIIVEDCSTDSTVAAIESFVEERRDPRFRLLRHEQNRGQLSAQITGFRACSGQMVVFLDSDDLLFADALESHLAIHLGCEPVAAMTCMDAAMIDGDDVLLSGHHREVRPRLWQFFRPKATQQSIRVLGTEVSCRIIPPAPANRVVRRDQYFWTTQSFMMFRYEFLQLILPETTEHFRICADYYLVNMAHAFNTTVLANRCGGAYRMHGANGFTQSSLISAEQESGNSVRFDWQHVQGAALAASIIAQRFEQFGIAFGYFRAARALLSVPGRLRPSVFGLLCKQNGFSKAAFEWVLALVSARIARLRITFGTVRRVLWEGY